MKSLTCGAGWRKLTYTHIVAGLPSIYLVVLIGIIVGWFGIIIWRFSCCYSLIGIIIRWFGIIILRFSCCYSLIGIIVGWFGIIILMFLGEIILIGIIIRWFGIIIPVQGV